MNYANRHRCLTRFVAMQTPRPDNGPFILNAWQPQTDVSTFLTKYMHMGPLPRVAERGNCELFKTGMAAAATGRLVVVLSFTTTTTTNLTYTVRVLLCLVYHAQKVSLGRCNPHH